MPRCGRASVSWMAVSPHPVPASWTANRSRRRKPAAPRGTTAEKNRWPCKRHLFVDTLGLIGGLAVLSAASTDWEGTVEVFRRAGQSLPHLAKVWADAAYEVWALLDWIQGHGRWVLEIGNKRSGQTTFEVHKWRWIVERTFGWFNRYRRLSKDYEHNPKSSETWIYIAMVHRMSRFQLPDKNRDDDLLKRPPKRLKT